MGLSDSNIAPFFFSLINILTAFLFQSQIRHIKHPEGFHISCRRTSLSLHKGQTSWMFLSVKEQDHFPDDFRLTLYDAPTLLLMT